MQTFTVNPGDSIQHTLDNLAGATEAAQVIIAPGTYAGGLKLHDTTAPVHITAAQPGTVTIDANGKPYALELYKTNQPTIEDISLTGASNAALFTTHTLAPTIRRVNAHHNSGSGFSFNVGTRHVYFTDCESGHNTRQGWTFWKVHSATINNIYSHDNDSIFQTGALGDGGHKLLHGAGLYSIHGLLHKRNRGGLWPDFMTHSMITVTNCKFIDNSDFGLYLEASKNITVEKTVIVGSKTGVIFATVADMHLYRLDIADCAIGLDFTGSPSRASFGYYGTNDIITPKLFGVTIEDSDIEAHAGQTVAYLRGNWGVEGNGRNPTVSFIGNRYRSVMPKPFKPYGTTYSNFARWQQETGDDGTWEQMTIDEQKD